MASGPHSGAAATQIDLKTIKEDVQSDVPSHEQSPSSKYYDCASPDVYSLNADISDFEPLSQGLENTHTPQNASRGLQGKKVSDGPIHQPSCAAGVSPTKLSFRSRPTSSQSKSDKWPPEDTDTLLKQPKRNSTNITHASAPLEETEAWDRKTILSLGTLLYLPKATRRTIYLTSSRWRRYPWLLCVANIASTHGSYWRFGEQARR